MTSLPMTQTPADPDRFVHEYVRILRNHETGRGYVVQRRTHQNVFGSVTVLATLCGGNMGKILALTCAETAAKMGLIETIYLDGDV